jgi:hypothetical protein
MFLSWQSLNVDCDLEFDFEFICITFVSLLFKYVCSVTLSNILSKYQKRSIGN